MAFFYRQLYFHQFIMYMHVWKYVQLFLKVAELQEKTRLCSYVVANAAHGFFLFLGFKLWRSLDFNQL